ncbi:hypothetical protein [Bifidobacterium parmae]|uniref:hypothetical protein n=1 Tax=Bifidobacterium parmae TaxID=361854 RepID=UPI0013FE1802|nr:hypothetical protein [Bifidobacterium parmae]
MVGGIPGHAPLLHHRRHTPNIIDNLQDDIAFYCDESGDDLPTNIAVHDEDID